MGGLSFPKVKKDVPDVLDFVKGFMRKFSSSFERSKICNHPWVPVCPPDMTTAAKCLLFLPLTLLLIVALSYGLLGLRWTLGFIVGFTILVWIVCL